MRPGVLRFVLLLTLVAVTSMVALAMLGPLPGWSVSLAVLAVIAMGATVIPIRFLHDGAIQAFTLEGGVVVALLLTGNGAAAPLVMASTSVIAHGIRSRDALKTAFNAARSAVETSVAATAFLLLAPSQPSPAELGSVLAVLAAVAAFEVTSLSLTTELMARLGQTERRATFRGVRSLWGVNVLGTTAYGIVLAAVMTVHPWIAVLSGLLMLVMYLGYRGYAAAISGERRAHDLNRMTHHLLDLPAGGESVGGVLTSLVHVFGAERGHMVVEGKAGAVEWRVDPDGITQTSLSSAPRAGLLATAMARGHGIVEEDAGAEAVAAPIVRKGEPIGAMLVAGRRGVEPWGEADASLLAAVANELAVALDNIDLLHQVEQERARLEEESTKLGDILTAATDGIVSILGDGTIEAWNPGMARITGVPSTRAVGQAWHAVLRLKDSSGAELAPTGDHLVSQALAGDHAGEQLSLQALRADGAWRWLQCTASPVRQLDGSVRGVVLVARDVTTERELDELKADFIATVSHELRTPLTPLKGFLVTLERSRHELPDEQRVSVYGAMHKQLVRLETLISDLLAVAELDHGQFELRPEPVQISELVADAVEVEAADDLFRCSVITEPDVTAVVDSVALVRIVRSLVSNAIKHTTGAVEVTVRAFEDHVEVAVRDEGQGIAPWDQQRVFNRFERLGNHLTRTQGPGLGLTIARSLAERMGGDVTLVSDVGQGATFVLHLPRARPRPVPLRLATEA